ncbi:GH25 family lysozyme [Dactylosporangium sp. NPDC049140]|uniref:GH25 family lysozyme n=1 Tax=Dactylosporangium sp. NPDC049140 TaxID=3155647 RepID=UPI0033DC43DB
MSLRFPVSRLAAATLLVLGGVLALGLGGASAQSEDDGGGYAQAGNPPGVHANVVAGASAATLPAGFSQPGIDVSSHDHSVYQIDWPGVAASGVRFAYVKATEGTYYTNPYFHADNTSAKGAGILTGAYAFARPDLGDPVGQANYFLDRAEWGNNSQTLVPFLDLEWPYSSLKLPACWNLTPEAMVAWIRGFVDRVKARIGRDMMIYTNPNWWNPCTNNSTEFGANPLDVADFGSTTGPRVIPSGWSTYAIWQYAGGNNSAGTYDRNAFNGDYAALTRLAGDVPADDPPVELRANANGRYVSTDLTSSATLAAGRDAIGLWERYDVLSAGNGDIALRSRANGLYVTADLNNGGRLVANRSAVGAWERFTPGDNTDGTISLFAGANGRYVTADMNNGGRLVANRDAVGAWEKFTKVPLPTLLSLRANVNGRIVTADLGQSATLTANRDAVGPWEQYDVIDLGGGDVALRAHANSAYVTADLTKDGLLVANRAVVGAWERFKLLTNADGSTSILAGANGAYVTADMNNAGKLTANRTAVGDWEKFTKIG